MAFIALYVTGSLKKTVIYPLIYSSDAPAGNPAFPEGVRVIQSREINLCGRGGVCIRETRASSNKSRCYAANVSARPRRKRDETGETRSPSISQLLPHIKQISTNQISRLHPCTSWHKVSNTLASKQNVSMKDCLTNQ